MKRGPVETKQLRGLKSGELDCKGREFADALGSVYDAPASVECCPGRVFELQRPQRQSSHFTGCVSPEASRKEEARFAPRQTSNEPSEPGITEKKTQVNKLQKPSVSRCSGNCLGCASLLRPLARQKA